MLRKLNLVSEKYCITSPTANGVSGTHAQSVSGLQKLLSACENELQLLDMVINIKKSCCFRIGPRCNVSCANISSQDGRLFSWVSELRYLGVFIVRSRVFKLSLVYAKRSFHRAVNSLFGKLLNLASEVVILELVSAKCFPVLLYIYTFFIHQKW